ncbi:type II toxin-antitoxin system HigB family toxin [Rubrivivax gelatinosus]|uniref:Addiction module toxin RelE n=1 Tax=Rubrivivax gelatinosus TaxID=28068 RepID=A0ABS1E1S6_RUBGE|nr:type II toxin-antitoxin system HigB family toxin [Rubrivivax gelatinosus]MBK1714842.1 addiction module toxin RelE [Rubrivivax gelatinosus]
MNVVARSRLEAFWLNPLYRNSEQALKAWYAEAARASWTCPQDIKNQYRSASFVGNNRVVFNIKGNDYRLIVALAYDFGALYIKFVGTHQQYDAIDAATVEME